METSILSAEGRINLRTYWLRWVIAVAINYASTILFPRVMGGSGLILGYVISLVISVFLIIQGIKRMHDVDKSGWFILIPIYNLILCLTNGTPGPNRFGDDPNQQS
ncbi:MAG TPA: DUF805 domain-containing protein [Candidatus Cloacimonadota bacterium]|nr:DUF805 domain-containing protein [Candidatus Cloacimonadota bacterium]HPS39284.1 DUF805 domain-containing protein [Candidatus Cloacimonadota bacterium]